ncbi:MAG: lysoplasmalogenase family protein, partial [Bacteroidota bacterium]
VNLFNPIMLSESMKRVALYSLCIVTMVLLALQLRWIFPGQATNTIFWGAILFMLSDSMIGLNKFTSLPIPIAWVRVGIMLTYLAGQWLVVRGSLQLRKKTD